MRRVDIKNGNLSTENLNRRLIFLHLMEWSGEYNLFLCGLVFFVRFLWLIQGYDFSFLKNYRIIFCVTCNIPNLFYCQCFEIFGLKNI